MATEIRVWRNVTPQVFETDIRPLSEPAVLRGLVYDWPIVKAARTGDQALVDCLLDMAATDMVPIAIGPSAIEGRFHYTDDMRSPNFQRATMPLRVFLQRLLLEAQSDAPVALAAQGLVIPQYLAGFCARHHMPLAPDDSLPRLWIGNAVKVATHNDPSENIACVVAGHRRFMLFPPEQIANLYIGPFQPTPAGTPVSMVHVTKPDLQRYPRFAIAQASALVADLEPGDAIYIPYQWYHHVESLDVINMLVNYWWDPARKDLGSAWDAMLHGMMSLRNLPPDQRRAWRAAFDHYVFLTNDNPAAHLPDFACGVLDANTTEDIAQMRATIISALVKASRQK
jgi:Cupin-like domain